MKLASKDIADIAERDEGALDLLKKRLLSASIIVLFFWVSLF